MEDASKYMQRPKLDGSKTEVYRVYYDKGQISFDLFLWLEETALDDMLNKGYTIFKAFPSQIMTDVHIVCKN